MHRLLLLRHAKSSHKDDSLPDFDRPLAKRGRKDCKLIGRWLADQPFSPERIISSPAKRAKQTARRVAKVIGRDEHPLEWDKRVYDADARVVLEILSGVSEEVETVMLVGHHFALESIILRMSDWADIPAEQKLIPTGAIAWLEFEGEWSGIRECQAKLKEIVRPRVLAKNAGE